MRLSRAVVLVLALTACASTPVPTATPGADARGAAYGGAIEAALLDAGDLPVAVPAEAPQGYAFDEAIPTGPAMSAWRFVPVDGSSALPAVSVCVLRGDLEPQDRCYADDDNVIGERSAGPYRVFIVSLDAGAATNARPFWRGIEFTTDWRSVSWLDGQAS